MSAEFNLEDTRFMKRALEMAAEASRLGEVPVGAVLVKNGQVVSEGFNRKEADKSPLAHAECLAILEATKTLGAWRLLDTTLYVTLEPCLMCCGAILQARIPRVFFGTRDAKFGAVVSLYETLTDPRTNHRVLIHEGLLASEAAQLLSEFFKKLRTRASK